MTKKVLTFAACLGASVGLFGGVALAAPAISDTGRRSTNRINVRDSLTCKQKNNNNVDASAFTGQNSSTGNARVVNNTTGGDATSGDAGNANEVAAEVTVSNPTDTAVCDVATAPTVDATEASIDDTGRNSLNVISVKNNKKVKVVNNNNLSVSSKTLQSAHSGNAVVQGNATGGSAASGSATNTSSSTFVLSVSN